MAEKLVDVNSFKDFFVPIQVLLEGSMGDSDANQLAREIVVRLGGDMAIVHQSHTALAIEQYKAEGHSLGHDVPCPACGDLDGCHRWKISGNSYATK